MVHNDRFLKIWVRNGGLSIENNCNIHLTSGNQGYKLVRLGLS